MSATEGVIEVTCPCCNHILDVDPGSGEVLEHREPKKEKKSLSDLIAMQDDAATKRSEAFQKAVAAEKNKSKRLKEQFEKGLKEVGDDVSPELREIDL